MAMGRGQYYDLVSVFTLFVIILVFSALALVLKSGVLENL
jgi:hypothetical protein